LAQGTVFPAIEGGDVTPKCQFVTMRRFGTMPLGFCDHFTFTTSFMSRSMGDVTRLLLDTSSEQ
jgi:hypothetical protein